jgi:hypothetical protein
LRVGDSEPLEHLRLRARALCQRRGDARVLLEIDPVRGGLLARGIHGSIWYHDMVVAEPPNAPDPSRVQLPGGPAPDQPIPDTPIDGIDFPTYARVSAILAEKRAPRANVLAANGLDEVRWAFVEQGFMLRIATAAMRGDMGPMNELDRMYVEAQDALGDTDPTRPLDRYADLTARMESGEPAAQVLASDGLSLADWARLQRAWTRRLAQDAEMTSTFRGWVEARKRR